MKIASISYNNQKYTSTQGKKYNNLKDKTRDNYKNPVSYHFEDTQTFLNKLPNFESRPLSSNIHLDLTEDETQPCLSIQIKTNRNFQEKQGIAPVYEIALRNKIQEKIQKNPVWKESDAFLNGFAYQIIFFNFTDLAPVLKEAQSLTLGNSFNNNDIIEAKKLAKAAYELYLHNACKEYDFSDIPANCTVQEYQNIIEPIKLDDIQEYNETLLKNSNVEIALIMNKNDYNANKNEIQPRLNNFL